MVPLPLWVTTAPVSGLQGGAGQGTAHIHFCPRVPKVHPLSPGVLLCRVPSGAVVQTFRSLHQGAGLGLNPLNVTSSCLWGAQGPAGKSVGMEGFPRGREPSGMGTEGQI